jgi:hypothetical protein
MLFAIRAYDKNNGLEKLEVIETIDFTEAVEYAEDLSNDIIKYSNLLESEGQSDVEYKVYPLDDSTFVSIDRLNYLYKSNYEEFLKKYRKR